MTEQELRRTQKLDDLAGKAGGYVSLPSPDSLEQAKLFAKTCARFGIHYAKASAQERALVDEVVRIQWAHILQERTGIRQEIPPSFSA
ncbi:MAG: hypothetical protein HDT27_05515 [Subdoligranulum sp.]|nr:hypothetical protein [Subdoligranulum sp.]MBD5102143.1 hypothetical protein [Subdoligranulum sp.]